MRILIVTDAFPPRCGGSGWSTYELARGLRARGHLLTIVQPRPGHPIGPRRSDYDGFAVDQVGFSAPNLPYVRNYFKSERLYPRLARWLTQVIHRERIDLVHGQHVLTCLPSIQAARAAGVRVVCTIRDYWPVCYWSDLIHDYQSESLCPECSGRMMTRCVRPRSGGLWPLALPMIPYMRSNLLHKRQVLSLADAVIAVSSTIADDLRQRAPELANTRIEVIPNPVEVGAVWSAGRGTRPARARPYAVYMGKLAPNKGVSKLLPALERAGFAWPLLVVGDGPERQTLEKAAARSGLAVEFMGWLPRDQALAVLGSADLLVFPSYGPESLSRVLLEASALGVGMVAMDTGGTRDIVLNGVTGILARTDQQFADGIARLASDPALRARLGRAAREHVAAHFDAGVVVTRVETLYGDLVADGGAAR